MGRDAGSVVRGREAAWGWYVVWFDDLYNVFYKVKSPLSVYYRKRAFAGS